MVVGEAPGATEDQEGRPFVGLAGKYLRDTLGSLGVKLDKECWVTNALICRPPNNATPDAKQIGYCRPNLLQAIETYEPRVIITLGRSALVSVIGPYWKTDIGEMGRWVGWKIPLEKHWVVPTYHPSYLLRMKNKLMDRLFADHLEMAFDIEESPPKQPNWESKIELLFEEDAVVEALEEIDAAGGFAAVDYECNCLKADWPEAKIFSCAVSNGKRTVSYPWWGKAIAATGKFLSSKRTRKIASNLKMEERWTLRMFNHGVRRWGWDTMLASHCLDNREGICSLKFQALVKLGVPIYDAHVESYLKSDESTHYNRIREANLKDLLLYGGMDAILEYRLAMVQRKEMGFED